MSPTPDPGSPAELAGTILTLVRGTVAELALERSGPAVQVDAATVLAGQDSLFDSFGLVTVVLEVERRIGEQLGVAVALADDRALSQARSPFRTVATLAEHALARVREASGAPGR